VTRPRLRPATDDDREFLCAVYGSTRATELARVPWPDEAKQAFVEQQFTAQDTYYREHYPTAVFQVILDEDVPVGRLYVDRWEREIRIMDIALLPQARDRGLGTELLRELIAESERAGKALSIHVEAENPARSLYERLGFVEAEDRGVYKLMRREP
jgi:ribosomal protein S18 acetylase RimI-like enzyme